MDFVIDGAQLRRVQEFILQKSSEIDTEIFSIYEALNRMGDGWKADSYSKFMERMLEFKAPLNDVVLAMMAYATLLADFSKAVKMLQDEVENSMNMTEDVKADDGGISTVAVDASFTRSACERAAGILGLPNRLSNKPQIMVM